MTIWYSQVDGKCENNIFKSISGFLPGGERGMEDSRLLDAAETLGWINSLVSFKAVNMVFKDFVKTK